MSNPTERALYLIPILLRVALTNPHKSEGNHIRVQRRHQG
jgi:hypothetical protein